MFDSNLDNENNLPSDEANSSKRVQKFDSRSFIFVEIIELSIFFLQEERLYSTANIKEE